MPNLRTVIVSHRTKHHAGFSGYGQFVRFLPQDSLEIVEAQPTRLPYYLRKTLADTAPSHYLGYDSDSVAKEFKVMRRLVTQPPGLIHYLNGERELFLAIRAAHLTHWRFVATFHKPEKMLLEMAHRKNFLPNLRGIIAVGDNTVDVLSSLSGHDRVRYIPLGVDCTYFTPDPTVEVERLIMIVGIHMRDFAQFERIVERVHEHSPDVRIAAVVPLSWKDKLPTISYLERHIDISDDELRHLYRSATCIILPLIDATANSSLLEAIACGTPVIATDVGGTRGYLPDTAGILCRPGNDDDFVDAIALLLSDATVRDRLAAGARKAAETYALPVIAQRILQFYHDLIE